MEEIAAVPGMTDTTAQATWDFLHGEPEAVDEQEIQAETETVEVLDERGIRTTKQIRKGRFRGNRVSLRLEMAAYFRRPAEDRLITSIPDDYFEEGNDVEDSGS